MSSAAARADALLDLGRADEAAALLREAIASEPESAHLHAQLAFALVRAERPKEALAAAETAAGLAPHWEWPHRLRAVALRALGKAKQAVAAAEEAVRIAPEESGSHEVLADCRLAARQLRGAYEAAERAVALDPASAGAHHTLGDVALERDAPGEAEEHYRRALELDPAEAMTLNNLAVALQRQGRENAAHELFERAARADPREETARGNLASTSRDRVTGTGAMTACAIVAFLLLNAIADGEWVAAAALGAVLAAGVAFVLIRSRIRARELSPAARMLLADQHWWQRIRLTRWRPWWWFLPPPIWLAVALFSFTAGLFEAFEAGWDGWAIGVELFLLALIVLAAHRSRLWLRRRGWISF